MWKVSRPVPCRPAGAGCLDRVLSVRWPDRNPKMWIFGSDCAPVSTGPETGLHFSAGRGSQIAHSFGGSSCGACGVAFMRRPLLRRYSSDARSRRRLSMWSAVEASGTRLVQDQGDLYPDSRCAICMPRPRGTRPSYRQSRMSTKCIGSSVQMETTDSAILFLRSCGEVWDWPRMDLRL